MKYKSNHIFYLFFGFAVILISCGKDYSPKPRGYFRINFPEKKYESVRMEGCPFLIQVPEYAVLEKDLDPQALSCWFDLKYSDFNAKVHFTYMPITPTSTLSELTKDAHEFAFKHTVKATGIDQIQIQNQDNQIYGLIYDIKGNTASNFQFYLTDSTRHYLRGALYFEERPNLDSIRPVLNFIKEDLYFAIENFKWDSK